jgi:hypothetical protein
MRVLFVTSLVLWLSVPRADAQTGAPWLIVPTTTAAADWPMEATAGAFRQELWNRGIEVWPLERAATRYEQVGSAPPTYISEEELADWESRSRAAIFPLAAGDYAEALDQLAEAQELSRRAPEQLNRDPARAQQALDACLYMVRALQQTGSVSLARDLTRECRQLVLRGEPSARMHPPEVMEMLARVDEARQEQKGALRISSEPAGCSVRVNGLLLGESPLEVRGLFPGKYRVQVECAPDAPGRVHDIQVGPQPVDVRIDVRLDDTVETRPILYLRYPDVESELSRRRDDAARLAESLPAGATLLMRQHDENVAELDLLRGSPAERQALVRVATGPTGPRPDDVARATLALIEGECKDFSDPDVPAIPCRKEPAAQATQPPRDDVPPPRRRPRGQFIAGLTLAGIGSAALITAYTLQIPRANAAETWIANLDTPESRDDQQRWLDLNRLIIWTGTGGAAALVAAMPLALPNHEKPPWWAWLSGGLGVGLAAFSIAYGVTAESEPTQGCTQAELDRESARQCVRRAEHVSLAVLTGLSAAPALTVPLVYLFRRTNKAVTPTVEVGRSGGAVGVYGSF